MNTPGLYVHVPFCEKVCDYCDFAVMPSLPSLHEEFVELLLQEAKHYRQKNTAVFESFQTLYLGGGTPSVLSPALLEKLLRGLRNLGLSFRNLQEFTMEMNPESGDEQKLLSAGAFGLSRVSLGLQTLNDDLLHTIGRKHSAKTGLDTLRLLLHYQKEKGIRVNADLMFSLPEQTIEMFLKDAETLAGSGIGHVSFYGLNIPEHSRMNTRLQQGKLSFSDEHYAEMYLKGSAVFERAGFLRYEVSNFAKPGEESIHNINYWKGGVYLGLGPSAHSYDGHTRRANPRNYAAWRRWIEAGYPESGTEKDVLGAKEKIIEFIWLSLRQSNGLNLNDLEKMGIVIPGSVIKKWVRCGYAERNAETFRLTGEGFVFMDRVVESLLP
ncbi:MAG: radical SAM family heme chaperone HemW [Fibrobacter sp.]|jgi:oxygen-independent coproporphyrinogen-3 oxidase|nr:radical SAM family heme chaperone HemW [Fibrobacter sp.]